jgi:antitoxin (DNA-binding transcriptional repressor) of toxin-antitoxin stability system
MVVPEQPARIRVGVRELRDNLSGYLRQAQQGASIVVMSHDQVVAEIVPPSRADRPLRHAGALKGRIKMAPDFDTLPDDILATFEE